MKRCRKCHTLKGLDHFYVQRNNADNRSGKCKECHKAYAKRHRKKPTVHHRIWKQRLKKNYGITEDCYNIMLATQGGGCKICGKDPQQEGQRLAVDHCHTTGIVRGILCAQCNKGLGNFKDDEALLRRAISYLKGE